jgi:hypothetical protein
MQAEKDPKKAAGACLDSIKLDTELYRLGHTKVNQITFYKLTSDFPPLVWKHPIENNSKFSFLPNPPVHVSW